MLRTVEVHAFFDDTPPHPRRFCFKCLTRRPWFEANKPRVQSDEKRDTSVLTLGTHNSSSCAKQVSINSNQIKSSIIKPNKIKSNQIESNRIKSNRIKSNQIKSNQIKSNQIKLYLFIVSAHRLTKIILLTLLATL